MLADTYFRKALQANPKYPPALREMVKSSFAQEKYLATRAYLQRLQEAAALTPEYLWIGVQAEKVLGDRNAVSSYTLILKNRYPESDETHALIECQLFVFAVGANQIAKIVGRLDSYICDVMFCHVVVTPKKIQ